MCQVEGDANDYVGKGLSGGKVVVYPKAEALAKGFVPEDNVIVGELLIGGFEPFFIFSRLVVYFVVFTVVLHVALVGWCVLVPVQSGPVL